MKHAAVFIALLSILTGCAIKEVIDIMGKSDKLNPPRWDMHFEVPLIEKTEDLSSYFSVPNIVNAQITMPPVQSFQYLPANTALDNLPIIPGILEAQVISPTTVTQPISVDLNEDGTNDVTIESIGSTSGFIEITIGLAVDGAAEALLPGDIALTYMIVEGYPYSFSEPVSATVDGKLKFRTTNFLNDTKRPIRPGTSGDPNMIDMEINPGFIVFNTKGKPSPLDNLDINNPLDLLQLQQIQLRSYEYTFDATFNFGTDYAIEGHVANETSLFQVQDQEVPLTASQNFIKEFTISLTTENHLPIEIAIQNAGFRNDDFDIPIIETFDDDTTTDVIKIPLGIKNTHLSTADSIFNKGTLRLNLDLVIPAGAELEISDNMYIKFIMGLSGDGQIDLNYF